MSTYENPWIHQGTPLESCDVTDYQGMVYLIRCEENGKQYIGKKFFWSVRKLPPLKGKKRKRSKKKTTSTKKKAKKSAHKKRNQYRCRIIEDSDSESEDKFTGSNK